MNSRVDVGKEAQRGVAGEPLSVFFEPRTVALIGASETPGSVGQTVLRNLIDSSFGGTVYPVNPKRARVLGLEAHASLADLAEPVDLAVIATPAASVPGIIAQCAELGVRGAIVLSAGFKETGAAGAALERSLSEARGSRLRVIGPNCLGVMNPISGLNATFAASIARPGTVGFISQSGALCTAILDWSLAENVGFSAFVSIGSMLDVGWGDLIQHLGDDPHTKSIVIYMESIGDARSFLSAAREVALAKPIIVIKAGCTEAAAKAAASHTGGLAGSDAVLDAAFRRCGVLRVRSIADLFHMAEVLSKQPRPRGPRLAIVTNAGGPGVLATDALIEAGGELAALSKESLAALDALLPPQWSRANPIDILGDASPERYVGPVRIACEDPSTDGVLVILTPQAMTDPTRTAEQLQSLAQPKDKPILASWMGGAGVAAGETILSRAGIPTFRYPDTAARAFQYMWRFSENLRCLYETPRATAPAADAVARRARVSELCANARSSGRTLLTEAESKSVLAAYDIPVVSTGTARDEDGAVELAAQLGYPVVLKLLSETIAHKTDVGGVQLNLPDSDAVRSAYRAIEAAVAERAGEGHFQGVTVQPMIRLEGYELILGSSVDPQFGPVLLFGAGGALVEVLGDFALGLPPLSTTLARRIMEQTHIWKALHGVRGRHPVDLAALERLLVCFSDLVLEQPWIREIDVNPLLASPEQLIALDARIVLHGLDCSEAQLPRPAIRPYPHQYVSAFTLRSGRSVTIRPIRAEDEPLMVTFHRALSDQSVYKRYLHPFKLSLRVAHERLARICFMDYDRELALVAEAEDSQGSAEILGVGRLARQYGHGEAEFSLLVADGVQRQGLGSRLLQVLVQVARDERLTSLHGDILFDNRGMQQVCERLGFDLHACPKDGIVEADLSL